ncbi:MAG: CaiB/BaiF CoA-transferase family protein [Thermodesulfobacteriota bacterium]|nr:CaiB/BaiF CoA-transferase family protein [Thermodesulfobacteriota bacterium]
MLPLEDVKVLDFSQSAAGPFCGMLLGDMGAEVIKVEPLTGDAFRPLLGGAWSLILNRNKRSIALNLRTEEGKEVALKLAKDTDIFLEAFTPGTIGKLGLSYDVVNNINPRVIYCSLSGYGQEGPYSPRAGYDVCSQAECGLMAATGEPDGDYVRIGASLIDYGTGMFAMIGMLLALKVREKTGKGQKIDVSLFDTGITWMNYWFANYAMTDRNPPRLGSGHEFATPYQVFHTKDNPIFIGVAGDKAFQAFCKEVGLENLLEDPKFNTGLNRLQNRNELVNIVQERVKKFTREEMIQKLDPYGVPYAPVNTISEVTQDPHIKARGTLVEMDSEKGKLKVPGVTSFRLSETPGSIRRPAPRIGEHSEEILTELGYSSEAITQLREKQVIL